jgi:DeoR/GlpR family transcriptional regulator of sugar metabolism
LIHLLQLLNINCIFSSCDFKQNNIEEKDFLKHLSETHSNEILEISKKENISNKAVQMITISNSTVFINSN